MYSNKAFLRCSCYTDMNETSFLSTKSNLVVAGNIYQLESFGEMRTGLNVAYHLFLSGKWRDCSLWLRSLLGLLGNTLAVTNLFFWQCCKTQHLNKSRTSWDSCSYFIRLFSFLLHCFNPLYRYLQHLHHILGRSSLFLSVRTVSYFPFSILRVTHWLQASFVPALQLSCQLTLREDLNIATNETAYCRGMMHILNVDTLAGWLF